MDVLGMLSYALPVIGEFGDIFWAPISAIIFYISFGGRKGAMGAAINFMEEALPFSDIVPTFTLGWLYFRFVESKNIPGAPHQNLKQPTVIDI